MISLHETKIAVINVSVGAGLQINIDKAVTSMMCQKSKTEY